MPSQSAQSNLIEPAAGTGNVADVSPDVALEHACARVILRLAGLTDSGDYAAALGLFCRDATMDRDGELISGMVALRQAYAQRPINRITRHVVSNIVVQRDGADCACASSYVTVYRHMVESNHHEPPYPRPGADVLGQYQDRLVRTPDGWRLASRITRTIFQFHDSKKG